jgi:hypothetical protein
VDDSKKNMLRGNFLRFTKDPLTLGQLDYSKLQKPYIKNTTGDDFDKIEIH